MDYLIIGNCHLKSRLNSMNHLRLGGARKQSFNLENVFLWSVANGRRAGEKKDDSIPVSQRQLTLTVSCPLRRVRTLVNNVLLPKLPLLTESKVHVLACSSSS